MRFALKEYQELAVRSVLGRLQEAREDYRERDRRIAFSLSAITGAGKTVMASAVFEALFDGSAEFEVEADPTAVVLWVTDDPNLNEQTRFRLMEASDSLGSNRLTIINSSFDAPKLEVGKVHFLNRQKLTAKTFITQHNDRTHTLWETIRDTIEDPDRTLYLVLDEAHRGMRQLTRRSLVADEEARSTTVLRLINGHDGTPPVPIVWGISATVDRFNDAMRDARERTTLPSVLVDNAEVQESGLLKDTIALDLPKERGSFTTVLAREAARETRELSELWTNYAQQENMAEPVRPLLIIQVPNKPSKSEIADLLDTVYEAWPELDEDAIANVFGEHTDETYGSHEVPYIAPQDVQDAGDIRVLLAKDAISTGWDCPRAETLVSLRPAKDRTHITQLLGRLVRTPLARRIDSDPRLNAVTCFLPRFDLATAAEVADIMTGAKEETEGPPPPSAGRVLIEPATMLRNEAVPDEVMVAFSSLPTKSVPRAPMKPVKRLLKMAAELALDELLPSPTSDACEELYRVLDGQTTQHKKEVEARVQTILEADIRRITANRLSGAANESSRSLPADQRTVNSAFHSAARTFGPAVANGYVKWIAESAEVDETDLDLSEAKALVAALSMQPAVVARFESAADEVVTDWFSLLHAQIKTLNDERQAAYEDLKRRSKEPQDTDLVVPSSRIEMTYELRGEEKVPLPVRTLHLLSDAEGNFPVGKLGTWEREVLDTELARTNLMGWYRNPSSASRDAIQIPWTDGDRWRSMQPDFLFFSKKADGSVGAALIDPHSHHLSDALSKLKALAEYGEEFADRFIRIEAISKDKRGELSPKESGTLRSLDMTDSQVRDIVRQSASAAEAYRQASQKYL
jgi:type III restriction enzyme